MAIPFDQPGVAFDSAIYTFDGVGSTVTETRFQRATYIGPNTRVTLRALRRATWQSGSDRVSVRTDSRATFDSDTRATIRE